MFLALSNLHSNFQQVAWLPFFFSSIELITTANFGSYHVFCNTWHFSLIYKVLNNSTIIRASTWEPLKVKLMTYLNKKLQSPSQFS
jgi:hypothetical protein